MKKLSLKKSAFIAVLFAVSLWNISNAKAASTNVVVSYHSSDSQTLIQGTYPNGFTANFTNTGNANETVMLDLELYHYLNGAHEQVKQTFKKVTLEPFQTETLSFVLDQNAPIGEYRLKAGIFTPDWSQTLSWYTPLETLNIISDDEVHDNNVAMTSSSQAYNIVKVASQPNHFSGLFSSPNTANDVLVDIEVYRGNERVFQYFADNVHFEKGQVKTIEADLPAVYTAADYRWSVGIFKPHWAGLIQWYDGAQKFTAQYDNQTRGTPMP